MICHNGDETTEHFILARTALEEVRKPMIYRLNMLAKDLTQTHYDTDTLLQLILDSSKVIGKSSCDRCDYESKLRALERQSITLPCILSGLRDLQLSPGGKGDCSTQWLKNILEVFQVNFKV